MALLNVAKYNPAKTWKLKQAGIYGNNKYRKQKILNLGNNTCQNACAQALPRKMQLYVISV